MKTVYPVKRPSGLTLVELMLAMLLSLVLMGAVVQMFLANKSTNQLAVELARMQENARYAAYILETSIRMAGFMGCSGRNIDTVRLNHAKFLPATFTPDNGIEGWESAPTDTSNGHYTVIENANVSDMSLVVSGNIQLDSGTMAVANSDIVRVWHIDGDGVQGELNGLVFTYGASPSYKADDIAMLASCTRVDIAKVCSSGWGTTNFACSGNHSTPGFLNDGLPDVQAYKLSGWLYYIGKRAGEETNPPALYRRAISQNAVAGTPQELVEGVESLQLMYGEDTDTDPDGIADRYVEANNVDDWGKVVSVRIGLLVQSKRNDLVNASQTFTFNESQITASDGRLRYPFMTSVVLRNRAP